MWTHNRGHGERRTTRGTWSAGMRQSDAELSIHARVTPHIKSSLYLIPLQLIKQPFIRTMPIASLKVLHSVDVLLLTVRAQTLRTQEKHDDCGRWMVKQSQSMQQAIRHVSGAFLRESVCVCVCASAHTYGAVNITWSVSNLVPEFVDSVHGIQRPIM